MRVAVLMHWRVTDRQTSRLVFTARLRPQGPNAPISRICGQNPRNDADATFLYPHISVVDCRCMRCPLRSAGGCRNGKLQNVSPPSVLFESSRIILQYTEDTDAKNDVPEF